MLHLSILLDGEGALADVDPSDIREPNDMSVAILEHGMQSGRPSVAIILSMPDGTTVVAQTSARLMAGLGNILLAKYPDLFDDSSPSVI